MMDFLQTQLFTSQLMVCKLLWCFYLLFGLSFWRHPFTAVDPFVNKWRNAKFLQICSDEETDSSTSWMAWGWVLFQQIFFFGWTIPLSVDVNVVKEWFCEAALSPSFPLESRCQVGAWQWYLKDWSHSWKGRSLESWGRNIIIESNFLWMILQCNLYVPDAARTSESPSLPQLSCVQSCQLRL